MSIQTDDTDTGSTSLSEDAAIDALMKGFTKGDPKAAKADEDDDQDDQDDEDQDDAADDGDDDQDQDDQDDQDDDDDDTDEDAEATAAPAVAADDQVITVTVDGVETTHTVGSLKRLAGQEASLTRKSQEADLVGGRAAAVLNAAIETALEDLDPYKDIDWLVLQSQMDPGEFEWHRNNAAKAQKRFDKLVGSAGEFEQSLNTRRTAATQEQIASAVQELTTDVPGWSPKLYQDILDYGVTQGLEPDDVAAITNPKVLKLLHKAMLQDRGAKAVAVKVKTAPAKVTKPSRQSSPPTGTERSSKAAARLQAGRGTDDDAIAVLKGRWK